MHFKTITLAGLAALAQAAAVAAEDTKHSTTSMTSSASAAGHVTTTTVTKFVTVHASSLSGHSHSHTATHSHAPKQTGGNMSPGEAAALAKKLHGDVTAVDRFSDLFNATVLKDPKLVHERLVFDFNAAEPAKAATGGRILVANEKNYPILTDLGISGAVAFLKPCSMNTPHTHPRATEFLTLVKGSTLHTGLMLENGFAPDPEKGPLTTQISAELSEFQATVFPQGSIHYQFNPTCEEAIFVSALSSSDPGTSQIAQNFFFENERIVNATLGNPKELNGANLAALRKHIPANLVQAMDSCVVGCKAKGHKI